MLDSTRLESVAKKNINQFRTQWFQVETKSTAAQDIFLKR